MTTAEQYKGMTPEDYARMAGVDLKGNVLPSSAVHPEEVAQQLIAQAKAKAAAVVPSSTTYNAAANAMGEKLLENLGAERQSLFGVTRGFSYKGKKVIGVSSSPKEILQATRDIIADKTPNEMIDAFAGADPSNKDLQEFAKIVKDNPKMAEALKNAIVKDPSMLENMPELLNAKGDNNFSLADLNKGLKHSVFGGAAQQKFTDALNVVADTGAGFDHLLTVGNKAKETLNMGFSGFLDMAKNNPDELIRNLFDGVDMDPQMRNFMAGMLEGLLPMLASFLDPNGFMLKPYVELGGKIWEGNIASGAQIFHAQADGQTSNFTVDQFKDNYQQAIGKYGRDANNPQHVRAAMIEADPMLRDELDEMLQNNQTSDKFNATAKTGFSLEKIGAFYEKISQTHNVGYGAKALGLGN